jgi:hypothetical protein
MVVAEDLNSEVVKAAVGILRSAQANAAPVIRDLPISALDQSEGACLILAHHSAGIPTTDWAGAGRQRGVGLVGCRVLPGCVNSFNTL